MKTRDLIAQLQEADPSGELEVGCGNADIHFIDVVWCGYDGHFQKFIRDESKKPYYDIVGVKVLAKGYKVVLHSMGAEDVIFDNPHAIVDLSELQPMVRERWEKQIEEWRKETREAYERNGVKIKSDKPQDGDKTA